MNAVSKTVYYYGLFMLLEGLLLAFTPSFVLNLVGFSLEEPDWLRPAGVGLMALGYYYIRSARANLLEFHKWTVKVRYLQFFLVAVIIYLSGLPNKLMILSLFEALMGYWTSREITKLEYRPKRR